MKLRYTAEFTLSSESPFRTGCKNNIDLQGLANEINSVLARYAEGQNLTYSLSVLENPTRKQDNAQNPKQNTHRADIRPGMTVDIVLKKDQPTGKLTRGVVARILTNSADHHRGIKVMLQDGQVGRVQKIVEVEHD